MAILKEWPWERIGNLKYFLFVPIILKALHVNFLGGHESDNWCFHVLLFSSLRYIQHQCWNSYARLYCLVKKHQIQRFGTDFAQIDREFHCDNFIIFQALVAVAAHTWIPGCSNLPVWNLWGVISTLLVHMGATEFLYYWAHRAFHEKFLFFQYHSYHHISVTPEPATGQ